MSNGYIKSLDGVRAVAIILVMSFHAGITHFGWMGVQLFFVLSGYLITGILWREKYGADATSLKLKRFWVRRSLRIFPLYFGYLIILGISYLLVHFPVYYPTYAPYLFSYTVNYTRLLSNWQGNPLFTHLWSLSIEEQFYLFFPLIVFLLNGRLLRYFLIAVIIITPLTRFLLGLYYQSHASLEVASDAVYWNTLSHLDAFFIGGIIPVLSLEKKIRKPLAVFGICLFIAFFAGLLNYIFSGTKTAFFLDLGYNHDQVSKYVHMWRYSSLNFLFASLILLLASAGQKNKFFLRRFFENKYLLRIGKVSYGMYIFHWCIFVYVYAHFFKPENIYYKILLFIPYLATVYIVAEISFRFYESYFIRMKDRFYAKTNPRPVKSKQIFPLMEDGPSKTT